MPLDKNKRILRRKNSSKNREGFSLFFSHTHWTSADAPYKKKRKYVLCKVIHMHENTQFIEDLTFQQVKMLTRASIRRMNSFNKQFSGV
jgi:hypothetical protein